MRQSENMKVALHLSSVNETFSSATSKSTSVQFDRSPKSQVASWVASSALIDICRLYIVVQ